MIAKIGAHIQRILQGPEPPTRKPTSDTDAAREFPIPEFDPLMPRSDMWGKIRPAVRARDAGELTTTENCTLQFFLLHLALANHADATFFENCMYEMTVASLAAHGRTPRYAIALSHYACVLDSNSNTLPLLYEIRRLLQEGETRALPCCDNIDCASMIKKVNVTIKKLEKKFKITSVARAKRPRPEEGEREKKEQPAPKKPEKVTTPVVATTTTAPPTVVPPPPPPPPQTAPSLPSPPPSVTPPLFIHPPLLVSPDDIPNWCFQIIRINKAGFILGQCSFKPHQKPICIGSDKKCDICITNSRVSPIHVSIWGPTPEDVPDMAGTGTLWITNQSKGVDSAPLSVNCEPVLQGNEHQLKPGDGFEIDGKYLFTYRAWISGSPPQDKAGLRLYEIRGAIHRPGPYLTADSPIKFGPGEGCDVYLPDVDAVLTLATRQMVPQIRFAGTEHSNYIPPNTYFDVRNCKFILKAVPSL